MRLGELTAGLAASATGLAAGAGADVEIAGLAYDSRSVRPGDLFFCVGGFTSDGHQFAPQAVANGAVALIVERTLKLGVPEVLVSSARSAMAPIAARFYHHPARELQLVGVTGTNGKTTTAFLVRALLEASGLRCGLLGTVKSVVGGAERPVQRTTPEAIDLQADLRQMVQAGDRACAMEVSSHALQLGRADALPFAAAVFTNISRDHLDFHPTMEEYFQAKRRLFVEPGQAPGVSVVNIGDPYGRRLAADVERVRTFAVDQPADYSATGLRCSFAGCAFTLHTPEGAREVALPMPGRFNVANALGALAAVHALGQPIDVLVAALERGVRVPGRFEPVDQGQDFAVLVDYAHTPDSLENVLGAARELAAGGEAGGEAGGAAGGEAGGEAGGAAGGEAGAARVICVFGAGGDRDRGKRPLMGEIAARLADVVLVTSDNPRSEDPEQIIAEIMAGTSRARAAEVRPLADRRAAIAEAIAAARRGDVIVIAGKGHEQGQELAGGRKVPFDDVTVARQALGARDITVAEANA